MGISLSGGDYQYNRFDAYEEALEEGKDASNPEEMKKKVDKAGKKAKKTGRYLSDEDKEEEGKEEVETATGGDSGGSMGEELNNQETGNTVMENDSRMAMYSRALGVMGAQYSGPGFGVSALDEKKHDEEDKKESKGSKPDYLDFDKDGDKKESMKKALKEKGDKEEVEEGYKPLPVAKMSRQADKAYGKEQAAVKAGDEAGANKQMQRRIAMNDPKGRKAVMAKEEVSLTKEMVVEYLVKEGYASNEVSAEVLHTHVSDEFLAQIEESMIAEMGPAYPSETKAQAKAQSDHRSGKSSAGLKTGKNPGLKASHTSGANKQD